MTILLGDNLYDRPDFIKLKPEFTESSDIDSLPELKKRPKNFKSIIQNGFDCFTPLHI